MILVDTSVWVDLLGRSARAVVEERELLTFATCGPVLQEVFQGLRQSSASDHFRSAFLALPILSDPVPARLFVAAAEIYRSGRQRGFTIRSSADCLIAAIAIENGVPVWHKDRDFTAIAKYTGLQVW